MISVGKLYEQLKKRYGYLGWWPVFSKRNTQGFDAKGYRLDFPEYPLAIDEIDEIIIGAVLTQNTAWKNVETAIGRMVDESVVNGDAVLSASEEDLAQLIKPSGYYNQKAKKLKSVFRSLNGTEEPTRDTLLGIWGIGPETADSILLYGYGRPEFVIDAYTTRVLQRLGHFSGKCRYDEVKRRVTHGIHEDIETYQNFHAYFVEFAKQFCRKKPLCEACPLKKYCSY